MFEWIARFAVERRALVLGLTLLFCGWGWVKFQTLPIEAFPDVTDPMVEVVGVYPGQAAEEVERRLTVELEKALAGTPMLRDLRSVSIFGLVLMTLTFEDGGSDLDRRVMVSERLQGAQLPVGAEVEMGPQSTPVGQIYRYTLRGPRSLRELRALQDYVIEPQLRSVPGVADVVTFGGFQRQYQVRVDPDKLAAAEVKLDDVYDAVLKNNENVGGGYVNAGSQELIVRVLGTAQRVAALGEAVVSVDGDLPVRVEDIADIVEGSTPRRGAVGRGYNDDVVEGIVLLRRGENPGLVLEALRERVDKLNRDVLPADVQIATFYDRTTLLDATLSTVGRNLVEGVLLVLAVVYLFLRTMRAVVIVAVVIPVSMCAAFVGLSWLGLPANLISLGAIDFGILVDGAIIVVESTLHALERMKGRGSRGLVQASAVRVAQPVGFSLLIIIIALAPIFTLERVEGRIFAPMAYTYAFALLGALVSAMVVVPALESLLMSGTVRVKEPQWLVWGGRLYAGMLGGLSKVRWLVVAAAVGVVAVCAYDTRDIGTEFLPELNEGGLYITAVFPSSIALDETRARVGEVRARILETPEVADVLSHVGRPEGAAQAEGPNNAEFFVVLAPEGQWRPGYRRADLEEELRVKLEQIPGVQYNFSQPITDRVFETISGIIGQVVVKVRGQDIDQLMRAAAEIRERVAAVAGVSDLALYQTGEVPQLKITLRRDALARRGLSVEDVQRTLRVALGGEVATSIWEDVRSYAVVLKLPDQWRTDTDALRRLPLGVGEQAATLAEVADISVEMGRGAIWRQDFSRFVALKFNVRGRDLGSTVRDAQAAAEAVALPEGAYLSWGGEFQNQARALQRLGVSLPLALAAILGILFMNFRRWKPTLLIFAFLPVAVIGAVVGLKALGENFSVSSAVGCIALLGQVVLSGVILCSRLDEARAHSHGDPMKEGAREAFRPLLMTTTLALLGLLPAATSHAMGSETQRPFAISIIAGLLLVTPAILFVLPLLYTVGWKATPAPSEPPTPDDQGGLSESPAVAGLSFHDETRADATEADATEADATEADATEAHATRADATEAHATRADATEAHATEGTASTPGGALLNPTQHIAMIFMPLALFTLTVAGFSARPCVAADFDATPTLSEDTATRFTLQDALSLIDDDHPLFAAADARSRAARAGVTAAGLWSNPTLDIDYVYGVTQSSYSAIGAPLIGVSQHLRSGDLTQARTRAAEATHALSLLSRDALRAHLQLLVEDAFITLAAIDREAELLHHLITHLEAAERVILARFEAKVAARYDTRRISIALADARAEVDLLESERARARADLDVILGPRAPQLQGAPLFDVEALSGEGLRAPRQQGTPLTLSIARAQQEATAADLDTARAEVFPGVDIRVIIGYGQAPGQLDAGVGVSIPLPLLDYGQGSVAAAEQQAAATAYVTDAVERATEQRIDAAKRVRQARLAAFDRYLAQTDHLLPHLTAEAESAYREGRFSVLELIDAHQSVFAVRVQRLHLAVEVRRADLDLRRVLILGSPTPAD
jgi:heavy metal efflux system protein